MCYKIILMFLVIFELTGCGFKLRSQSSLPPEFHKVYIQTDNPYGQFESAFKKSLVTIGIAVLDKPEPGCLILSFSPPTFTSDNSSIGGSVQARVYNLSFSVGLKINNSQNQTIIDTQTITVTKGLTLSPGEVFSASNQVDMEKESMQQEAIIKIFNILESKRTFEILHAKFS